MFTSLVTVTEDGNYWRLYFPLAYKGNEDEWEIEAGFRTDFGSIPRLARWLLSPTGKHNRPTVLHDYLYRIAVGLIQSCRLPHHGTGEDAGCPLPKWLSRRDADRIFLRAMREVETLEWQARLMYLGVRAAAWLRL